MIEITIRSEYADHKTSRVAALCAPDHGISTRMADALKCCGPKVALMIEGK